MNPLHNPETPLGVKAALLGRMVSECIHSPRFFEAALTGGWYPEEEEHLQSCARCRTFAARVKAVVAPPTAAICRFRAVRTLHPLPMQDAASCQGMVLLPEEEFLFENDRDLVGSLYHEGDRTLWLALEHTKRPEGTLLLVEVGDTWRRFLLLRGTPVATAKLSLEDAPLTGDPDLDVAVYESAADLAPELAPLLAVSFEAVCREDPAGVPVWRAWAAQATECESVPAAVAKVLAQIATGPTPPGPR